MSEEVKLQSLAFDPSLIDALTRTARRETRPSRPSIYRTWASYYDGLMRVLRYAQTRRAILNDFLPALPCGATILDVGCGTGICTDALKDFYPDADIRGLDQSPEMLSQFRQRHPGIPALSGDFNHLSLLDSHPMLRPATYDFILSAGALSEYGSHESYALVARLLKEGGLFLNIGIQRNVIGRLIGAVWGFHPSDPRAIVKTCQRVGFSDVSAYRLSWECFPRTLIDVVILARKRGSSGGQEVSQQEVSDQQPLRSALAPSHFHQIRSRR